MGIGMSKIIWSNEEVKSELVVAPIVLFGRSTSESGSV